MTYDLSTIRARRKALGLSRPVFALQAGVSVATIAKIEHDGYVDTTKKVDRKIFSALERLERQGVGDAARA